MKIFATDAHLFFAEEISQILGIPLGKRTIKKFSCGEYYVNFDETLRGQDVFLISTIRPEYTHEDFFEMFLLCDAARRSFAKSIHVVLPHFGYSRQDKIHAAREPISMKLCADLLTKSGSNHLITLHLHADQSQAFFDVPVDNLSPRRDFIQYFSGKNLPDPIVVSPDAGGAKNAKKFADGLGLELVILHKSRSQHNTSEITHLIGDVAEKTPIIFDDMIDTAGSVCGAKKALIANGSRSEVYLCATHPVFSGPAVQRLTDANFTEIVVSNSIPIDPMSIPSLQVLSVSPLFAQVIRNVVQERSVSELHY